MRDPTHSQDHRDRIAKQTGVERGSQVADHENVILIRLKVPEAWLYGKVVAQVHQAVARGTDEGVQPDLEEE